MKEKRCAICGQLFEPSSSRQKYCNKVVLRTCAVCGNEYESTCSLNYSKTCSDECKHK